MIIEFLGTGGYHPSEQRHTACLLLPELGVALDAGTAAFRLARHLKSDRLSIFLSHAHWDHIIGLTYLLVPMARGELNLVTVHGNRATIDAVSTLLFAQPTFPVRPAFEFRVLEDHPVVALPTGATLTHWPQPTHPGGSTGFRIDWDDRGQPRSVCYVTDTCVDEGHLEQVRDTDLLIHECYFPDARADWALKTGHSCLGDVLDFARRANVKRLILTHVDPNLASDADLGLAEAKPVPFPVSLAHDGDSVDI